MKLGMGHPMGPQLVDFIGWCLAILNVMYDGFKTLNMRLARY
jgi:hypothetical protein